MVRGRGRVQHCLESRPLLIRNIRNGYFCCKEEEEEEEEGEEEEEEGVVGVLVQAVDEHERERSIETNSGSPLSLSLSSTLHFLDLDKINGMMGKTWKLTKKQLV